jgi:hypothetical protein
MEASFQDTGLHNHRKLRMLEEPDKMKKLTFNLIGKKKSCSCVLWAMAYGCNHVNTKINV